MTEGSAEDVTSIKRHYGFSTPQCLFERDTLAVLVDLTVLDLFEKYWRYVTISKSNFDLRQLST
jgi:hypothetical protein